MVGGALRMQALIEGLLDYSRVGSRKRPFGEVDAGVAAREAMQNLSRAIEESEATVTCGDLPVVTGDHTQIVQLFQNVIANAVKFRGEAHPRVHISARRQSDEWVFSVRDNGIGIDADQRERVFMVFKRLHSQSVYPGTGVGLAIATRIVERHGGRIWIDPASTSGTTFLFTLPPFARAAALHSSEATEPES
jgi:light-regulated signal transduction histidine kinase (bacteriophytochrome)